MTEKQKRYDSKNILIALFVFLLTLIISISFLVDRLSIYFFEPTETSCVRIEFDGLREDEAFLKTWTNIREIDLFNEYYKNNNGDITVESDNKQNVIAPGTSGKYILKLENRSNKHVDYVIAFTSKAIDDRIPVQIRIEKYTGGWISLSKGEWKNLKDSFIEISEGLLDDKSKDYYIINWKWDYDGNDKIDTELGNLATKEELSLKLVAKIESRERLVPTHKHNICCLFSWIAVLFVVIIIIDWFKKVWRKKHENN